MRDGVFREQLAVAIPWVAAVAFPANDIWICRCSVAALFPRFFDVAAVEPRVRRGFALGVFALPIPEEFPSGDLHLEFVCFALLASAFGFV